MPLIIFAIAALLPAFFLVLGILWGGFFAWAAFFYITAFAALMDSTRAMFAGEGEFPATPALLAALGLVHLALFPALIWAIAADGPMISKLGLFLGASLWLGQISNPMAHELIHQTKRGLFWLGAVVFSTMAFGHHTSAHRLVHHRHAASPADPNTARSGEGFYAFFLRAWRGSFILGWRAEKDRRGAGLHPYVIYLAIAAISLIFAALLGGVWVWVMLCLSAQAQLLLSDYVQHYGLSRKSVDGRLEPVADRHSWNAPFWFSSAMMLNAPRHSDHHAHPARPFTALRSGEDAPQLPWPLPLACTIALAPPIWKRKIRPHLKPWL